MPEHSVCNQACPQEKLFKWSLTEWVLSQPNQPGEGKYPTPAPGLRSAREIHSLGHRLTKRLRPNHRTTGHLSFPCSAATASLKVSLLEFLSSSVSRQLSTKITRQINRQKAQFKETGQISEQDSDMIGLLELPDC